MDRVILTHESIPDMGKVSIMGKVAIHIATHASTFRLLAQRIPLGNPQGD